MFDGPRGFRPGSCGGPGHTPNYRGGGCGTAMLLILVIITIIVI